MTDKSITLTDEEFKNLREILDTAIRAYEEMLDEDAYRKQNGGPALPEESTQRMKSLIYLASDISWNRPLA
jgi:hypothetical protein